MSVSLEQFATISAALAEGTEPQSSVLARHGVTDALWLAAQVHWNRVFFEEAEAGAHDATDAYARAFAAAQDALKAVPVLSVEAWAELTLDVAHEGGDALARRALTTADHMRLSRHWSSLLASDRQLSKQFAQAVFARSRRHAVKPP